MKKLITLALFITFTIFVPAAAAQDQCSQETKDALYASFLKNRKDDQAKAYEDAKKYLACPVGEVTEAQQKIIDYLKLYSTRYEEGMRKIRFRPLLYNEKKYPEAYALGSEILAKEPDNLQVLIDLGVNAYLIAANQSLAGPGLNYARRALQQLESGKNLDDWQPLSGRDAAIAYLNYSIATLSIEKDPTTALKHLIKVVEVETPLKKSPYTYAYIGGAYETGDYAKQSADYKAKFSGKDETPESKLALANINQIVDRMIDAYARAVALAGSDPVFAAVKKNWMESLTTWYKYRNNDTDTGLPQVIETILSKPLPPIPTPLITLPPQ